MSENPYLQQQHDEVNKWFVYLGTLSIASMVCDER